MYEGYMEGNKQHGKGKMTYGAEEEKVESIKGTWENGTLISCKILTMKDGTVISDCFDPATGKLKGQG